MEAQVHETVFFTKRIALSACTLVFALADTMDLDRITPDGRFPT
jgi:hypothetical protein